MKNTRENIVKLLEIKRDSEFELREGADDQYYKDRHLHFAMAYQEAIWFLTDEKYFKDIAEVYNNII